MTGNGPWADSGCFALFLGQTETAHRRHHCPECRRRPGSKGREITNDDWEYNWPEMSRIISSPPPKTPLREER